MASYETDSAMLESERVAWDAARLISVLQRWLAVPQFAASGARVADGAGSLTSISRLAFRCR
jgi:hypothetical protein